MTDTAKPDMRAKLTCDHGKWERHLVSWVNNTPATEAIWCGGATLLESSDIILIRKVEGEWPEEARAVLKSFLWGGKGYTFNSILDALADSLAKEGDG